MTAARNLTDADVEAIADALERRGLVARRRVAEPDSANEAPLSREAAERVRRIVREKSLVRRLRSGRPSR